MALAILNHMGASGSDDVFEIEIGENRFYRLRVGTEPREDGTWGSALSESVWEGPVEGPIPESRRGRARVRLPSRLFDRETRFVQLVSARDRGGSGQAVSEVREVRARSGARTRSDWGGRDFDLSPPARDIARIRRDAQAEMRPPGPAGITNEQGGQAMSHHRSTYRSPSGNARATHMPGAYAMTVLSAGNHRPALRRMPVSEAAGIGAIVSAIGSLAPQVIGALQGLGPAVAQLAPTLNAVAPAIGSLLGGMMPGLPTPPAPPSAPSAPSAPPSGGTRGAASGAASGAVGDAAMQRMLVDLLRQAIQAMPQTAAAANNATNTPRGTLQTAPAGGGAGAQPRVARARSIGAADRYRARPRRSAPAGMAAGARSEAFVAPALLAALPALAPILQNVLNPQTVQAAINAPNQHMGTIINGIKDFMKLGIQSHEQDLSHLRQLTPGHADPELTALLASMSLGLQQAGREEPRYKRVGAVKLAVTEGPAIDVQGVELAGYRIGSDWGIELTVDTPRTIPDGQVRIFIKDAETLEILVKGKGPKGDIQAGPLPQPIAIPADALEVLDPGRRYLLCMHVIWKNKSGKPRGTSIQQEVVALGETSFERIELDGEVVALADPVADRAVWHEIWSGPFDRDRKSYDFDLTYRVGVRPGSGGTDRKPTRMRTESEGGPRVKARLLAETTIPLSTLIDLREELMPDGGPISPQAEAVLRSTAFAQRMTLAAKTRLEIRGLAGKTGTIWAYLGVKLGKITLNRVERTDDLGRVQAIGEEELAFPIPVSVTFAGYRTSGRDVDDDDLEPGGNEAPEMLNGMKKVFERQATLAPEPTRATHPDAPAEAEAQARSRRRARGNGRSRSTSRSRRPAYAT